MRVCVPSCDICSELSLLSAQWSCEFNLSGTINLSAAACCLHVLAITNTWSLTSIYGSDKRGVRTLRWKYPVVSIFFVHYQAPSLGSAWNPHLSDLPGSCSTLTDGPCHLLLSHPAVISSSQCCCSVLHCHFQNTSRTKQEDFIFLIICRRGEQIGGNQVMKKLYIN